MRLSGGDQIELARILGDGGLRSRSEIIFLERWEEYPLSAFVAASEGAHVDAELYRSIDRLLQASRVPKPFWRI